VSWFVNNFAGIRAEELGLGLSVEELLETAAAKIEPGAGYLFAVPYWSTAATPYWDAQAQGIMLGWNGSHTKAHAYRAILEGIAFETRLMTDGVEAGLEAPIERFSAMGGGSRSPLWCQIVADVTNREVVVCKEVETTALGAAMQAAAAAGNFGDIREAAEAMSGEGAVYSPDGATAARYDRLYTDVYKEIYPRVASLFQAIDALKR
jgi:xylulokinase